MGDQSTSAAARPPSFLSSLAQWTGFGCSLPSLDLAMPKVRTVSAKKFCKAMANSPNDIGILRFHPTGSPAYINAMSTSLADDLAEPDATPPPPSAPSHPSKYDDFADSVFSKDEFNKLPPLQHGHRSRGWQSTPIWPSLSTHSLRMRGTRQIHLHKPSTWPHTSIFFIYCRSFSIHLKEDRKPTDVCRLPRAQCHHQEEPVSRAPNPRPS